MPEWWQGLPYEIEPEWWEGLPFQIEEPPTTRRISLAGGELTLIRQGDRWSVEEYRAKDGTVSPGLQELNRRNLMLDSFTSINPQLVETGGVNKHEDDCCPRCFSERVKIERLGTGIMGACKEYKCLHIWTKG